MHRLINPLIAAALVALALAGCQRADKAPSEEILKCQIYAEPPTLHPLLGQLTTSSGGILVYMTETLTAHDPETNALTGRVSALPEVSEDFTRFTYRIHPEAAWPDGEPITAADVIFSAKACLGPSWAPPAYRTGVASRIAALEGDPGDNRIVHLTLKDASIQNRYFMNDIPLLDKRFFDPEGVLDNYSMEAILSDDPAIINDSTLMAWGESFMEGDNGLKPERLRGLSGPYQVVEWVPRERIVLSQNPNYWASGREGALHAQGPKQIVFIPNQDPNSIELQVKQGVVDVASFIPFEAWKNLRENAGAAQDYDMVSGPRTSALYIGFNCKPDGKAHAPIFSDWRVRRAVAHLFSVEAFNQENYGGQAVPIASPVPVSSDDYNQRLQPRVRSRDSAAYWLDQAGWKDTDGDLMREKTINGERVELKAVFTVPNRPSTEGLAQIIATEARAVGMEVELAPTQIGQVAAKMQSADRDYDFLMMAMSTSLAPYEFEQQWTTEALMRGSNFFGYTNPVLDSLSNLSASTYDLEERRPLMMEMQRIWYHDQPAIMLVNLATFSAVHKRYGVSELSKVSPYLWVNTLVPDKQ